MAIRDKMAERAQPFLEAGEQIRQVMMAQTGPSPYFAFLSYLILLLMAQMRMIVVTDRAIVVLKASKMLSGRPKSLIARYPRNMPLGPVTGSLWTPVTLGGDRMWVHRRFHKDIRAADEEAGMGKAPEAPKSI
jgi:hypothetical protein